MAKKIKVVIASNILDKGGAERTVQTIAEHINRDDFSVTVLCMDAGGSRVEALQKAGIKVLVGDGSLEKIKELIPEPDIDVLHFHRSGHSESLHPQVVNYLKPKKLMETNVFAFRDPVLQPQFDLQVYKSMMMLTQRVWKGQKPSRSDWWQKQRVIYNPVTIKSFDKYQLSPEEIKQKRQALGLSETDIVVGRVGRDDPVKWGDLLLSALPYLKKRLPQVKILLRTAPQSRLKWLKKHDYFAKLVTVLPETSDEKEIAATYQLMDIYLHPSRRGEAFGNTLNEAMVWGLPIVVENTPHWDNGQLEQVDHQKTGLVIKSVDGLLAALQFLVKNEDKRKSFGQAGRKKVIEQFALDKGVAQYELAYRQLAGEADIVSVESQLLPSPEAVVGYNSSYPANRALDFKGSQHSLKQWRHRLRALYWRLNDSLTARGIKKL